LDFAIWDLVDKIATPRQIGARNDKRKRAHSDKKGWAIKYNMNAKLLTIAKMKKGQGSLQRLLV